MSALLPARALLILAALTLCGCPPSAPRNHAACPRVMVAAALP